MESAKMQEKVNINSCFTFKFLFCLTPIDYLPFSCSCKTSTRNSQDSRATLSRTRQPGARPVLPSTSAIITLRKQSGGPEAMNAAWFTTHLPRQCQCTCVIAHLNDKIAPRPRTRCWPRSRTTQIHAHEAASVRSFVLLTHAPTAAAARCPCPKFI